MLQEKWNKAMLITCQPFGHKHQGSKEKHHEYVTSDLKLNIFLDDFTWQVDLLVEI